MVWMGLAVTAPAKEFWVYFGTYTNALSQGIYVSRLDGATGKLSAPELAVATPSPCYLAVSPGGKFLYAANSIKTFNGENAGAVSAFMIDRDSGKLSFLNEKSSGGSGPCYVGTDAAGKVLLAANYNAGSVKTYGLAADGSIGADGSLIQHKGLGVNASRQAGPHAHFISVDPTGRFVMTCDLGLDEVVVYKLDPDTAKLEVNYGVTLGPVPPGAGARHLAFSRDGQLAYVLNEMGCSITTMVWDAKNVALTPRETISALPPGEATQNAFTAAEILVHPNGRFVYATIRGHDSVSVFAVGKKNGKLTFVQNIPAGGKFPRGLGIDPTGHWLITGNQKSDNAAEFAIDPKTGKLTPTGQSLTIGSPVDVKFVPVK